MNLTRSGGERQASERALRSGRQPGEKLHVDAKNHDDDDANDGADDDDDELTRPAERQGKERKGKAKRSEETLLSRGSVKYELIGVANSDYDPCGSCLCVAGASGGRRII